MKISIVMACYNAEETVGAQLEGLAKQIWDQPWELIVANNKCEDNSITIVKQFQDKIPNLRIVDASERQGQPYALNCGIEAANGQSIILCDSDDVAGAGWLATMADALETFDFVASRFEIESLNCDFALGRGSTQIDGLQKIWYPPYLPHAAGCTLAFKKSLFTKIGGFDEALPYLHDTHFCFQAQLLGIQIHFLSDAVMHVRYRDTFKGMYHQSKNYAEYNVLLAKMYADYGKMNENIWELYARDWWKIIRKAPHLKNEKVRGNVCWLLGRQIGRILGVLKHAAPPV